MEIKYLECILNVTHSNWDKKCNLIKSNVKQYNVTKQSTSKKINAAESN